MAKIEYNELRPGAIFLKEGQPYECLEYQFVRMQQRKPVAQLKIKNLLTGKVMDYTAHQTDVFEEAEIEKHHIKFLYTNRGEYWFCNVANPKERFSLNKEMIGAGADYLKQNTELTARKLDEKIIGIELPIKIELKVTDAPPAVRGDTAQGGNKIVTLETGAKIQVPMFIETGDIIRVNTETQLYTERVSKAG